VDLTSADVVARTPVLRLPVIDGCNDFICKLQMSFASVGVDVARPGRGLDRVTNAVLVPYDFRFGACERAAGLCDQMTACLTPSAAGAHLLTVASRYQAAHASAVDHLAGIFTEGLNPTALKPAIVVTSSLSHGDRR